ncbi:hypothetical protein [Desulfosporosinus sp. Sb-LF]|uniref:hypothetical protein n=1 Tax=Desulfosporosinus sp. Sb-LF TaxID=2560027 RepID=UPI001FB0D464
MGNGMPDLTGSVVFTDFAQDKESQPPVRGVLDIELSPEELSALNYAQSLRNSTRGLNPKDKKGQPQRLPFLRRINMNGLDNIQVT